MGTIGLIFGFEEIAKMHLKKALACREDLEILLFLYEF